MEVQMNDKTLLKEISNNVIKGNNEFQGVHYNLGDQPGVIELTQTALEQHIEPERIMEESLAQSMEVVDQKYKSNDYLTSIISVGALLMLLIISFKSASIPFFISSHTMPSVSLNN
jgi:methanogenic corrinoid protein MtbC1